MSNEIKLDQDVAPSSTTSDTLPKKRGRKLGRAARRRKNKIRAIRQSVQILLSGGGAATNTTTDADDVGVEEETTCLPTDRNRSLPGVIVRRRQHNHRDNSNNNDLEEDDKDDQDQLQLQCNGFNKDDESMLTSQLGFIPGNGISVASRVKNVKELYPCLFKLLSKPINNTTSTEEQQVETTRDVYPIVLQLYPLVTRDVYDGGKSDGRKFKSRKRGHSQLVASDESNDNDNNNNNSPDTGDNHKTTENNTMEKDKNVSDNNEKEEKNEKKKTDSKSRTTIEPFPTMYWLTHPHLRTLISQLEIEPTYNVKTMEQKLSTKSEYLNAMHRAHESYGNQRWELLTDEDKKDTTERRWVNALGSERGVAGIRKFDTVKCLHAHAAHYLAYCGSKESSSKNIQDFAENLVGRWTLEAVEELIVNGGKTSEG